ncbi:MAG: amino acid permease [Rhodothermales bacterium]|nr:amino acid permease [Rhodothermales bacterium]MBO6780494.1 amino acid permease [Rhodothermales bacterium]
MTQPPGPTATASQPAGLGTFAGVFTPSILTILGVIMYLRFGWVVGNVGLGGTLLIVTLATSITFLTALSISSIATAQDVKGGGAYFMISRSLGIEAGGAVGIPLYFAQALSVALYTIGFAESVASVFPQVDARFAALVTTVAVALVALTSARFAMRIQYGIMLAIALSLLSLVLGDSVETQASVPSQAFEPAGFWTVFAVFFPAVTGIMAGVNMSGDLAEPRKAIPTGTLAAVGTGYVIYMSLPVLLNAWATPEQLVADPMIMTRMARFGEFILLGIWGATLSSAVGSILGAPRVLQALARDGALPRAFSFLGSGSGPDDEPRIGTAVTLGVAIITVMLGNLNAVAPVLSMFFLATYGVLNVTAGLERFLGNPSFRPELRIHWFWSAVGAAGCVAVMFLINGAATVAALVIVGGIYIWLERQELKSAWGDVRLGLWLSLTRAGLLRLRQPADAKNWRPHFLVLSGAPTKRWHLVEFAAAISHNRGLLTVASVLPPDMEVDRVDRLESTIREYMDRQGVPGFVRVLPAESPFQGSRQLLQTYGLGALVPNTVVIGATGDLERLDDYAKLIRLLHESRRNTLIVRYDDEQEFGQQRRIDLWWSGLKGNGGLMITLAYMLRTSLPWRGSVVTVKMVVPNEDAAAGARRNLSDLLASSRTGVLHEVIVSEGRAFPDILRNSSEDADIVFLGLKPPDEDFARYYRDVQRNTRGLPTTVFVRAAEDIPFEEVIL